MTGFASIGSRFRKAWQEGGPQRATSVISEYLAWRLRGSPIDAPESPVSPTQRAEAAALVSLMRDWYTTASPKLSLLVSVILPTRGQRESISDAIESVRAQSYPNWELWVVNDSPSERLDLADVSVDGRIHILEAGGKGVGAARNLGLETARGEVIAFVDDDNVMDRHWLKSVVLAFERNPAAETVIGAQVVMPEPGAKSAPFVRFPIEFDWSHLIKYNFVDMGMLAHKPHPTLRFDEALPAFVDWDYIVRLTYERGPTLVPALSGIYHTGAAGRISYKEREPIRRDLLQRFKAMSSEADPHSRDDEMLSSEDRSAVARLIKHLDSNGARRLLLVGTSSALSSLRDLAKMIGRAEPEHLTDDETQPPERAYDLIVLDGTIHAPLGSLLGPDGLALGIGAHQHRYERQGLEFGRRIGDKMWIASRRRPNLERLFDGVTLVKLGLLEEE